MSRTGTPLIKVNEGMTFWTDEPSQNLMGGEYFHFEKGVKKQKKGVLIEYKWRPDVVKSFNVHLFIFKYFRVVIQKNQCETISFRTYTDLIKTTYIFINIILKSWSEFKRDIMNGWGKRALSNSEVWLFWRRGLKLDLEKNHASRFVSHSLFNVSLDSVYPRLCIQIFNGVHETKLVNLMCCLRHPCYF